MKIDTITCWTLSQWTETSFAIGPKTWMTNARLAIAESFSEFCPLSTGRRAVWPWHPYCPLIIHIIGALFCLHRVCWIRISSTVVFSPNSIQWKLTQKNLLLIDVSNQRLITFGMICDREGTEFEAHLLVTVLVSQFVTPSPFRIHPPVKRRVNHCSGCYDCQDI